MFIFIVTILIFFLKISSFFIFQGPVLSRLSFFGLVTFFVRIFFLMFTYFILSDKIQITKE